MAELSDHGERQADASSHRTAKAAARAVAELVCLVGDLLTCDTLGGTNLYFKKMTLTMMWCMVSGIAKSEAAEQN